MFGTTTLKEIKARLREEFQKSGIEPVSFFDQLTREAKKHEPKPNLRMIAMLRSIREDFVKAASKSPRKKRPRAKVA